LCGEEEGLVSAAEGGGEREKRGRKRAKRPKNSRNERVRLDYLAKSGDF